jgi:iron(III) transport system substrate-binding protein
MDYLLSDEAQNLVAAAYLLPGRSDIRCTNRANVAEIPVLKTDWNWMMNNSAAIAARLIRICK